MKKALSLLLAALLLAGCTAQPAPESAASPPPVSVAEESPSRPLATPSGEGAAQASQVVETTLSLWGGGAGGSELSPGGLLQPCKLPGQPAPL